MKRLLFSLAIAGVLVVLLAARGQALFIFPPPGGAKIYNPPVTYQFGDPFAAGIVYGQARDTFAWVTTGSPPDLVADGDVVENNSANTLYWDLRSPVLDLGSRFFVDLYPINGYNHIHLGFADPSIGAQSIHIWESLPDGFGCFCDPNDAANLKEGAYFGFGYTHAFPWFFTYPICNWQGMSTSQGLTKAGCPGYSQGRVGVTPHDGNEMYVMSLKNSKDNTKTFAAAQPFTLNNIVTGGGGDMEIYIYAPDNNYYYFGPIPPNTIWTPSPPQPALEIYFHDWQGGFDLNGNSAPDHRLIAMNFQPQN